MINEVNEHNCGILKYIDPTKLLELKDISIQNNNIESIEGLSRMQIDITFISIRKNHYYIGNNHIRTIKDFRKAHLPKLQSFICRS